MKKILTIILFSAFTIAPAYSAISLKTLSCKASRGAKTFTIDANHISMKQGYEGRSIASQSQVRTVEHELGFTKHFSMGDGNKYILHVKNVEDFSEVEDYLIIRNQSGHEITYPIQCES